MRPKLISITRRYFRLSSSSISSSSCSSCIFQSRNHASSSSSPLFKNTSSDNSISSAYNKDLTFKSFSSPTWVKNIKKEESPNQKFPSFSILNRYIRAQPINYSDLRWEEDSGPMTDYLTRLALIMERVLSKSYPDVDKQTISAMLLIIISELENGGLVKLLDSILDDNNNNNPSPNFNQGLWETVCDVSYSIFEAMCEDMVFVTVKTVRDVREGMFRDTLLGRTEGEIEEEFEEEGFEEEFEEEEEEFEEEEKEFENEEEFEEAIRAIFENVEDKNLKKKKKIKYNIYGLDLSDPRFAEIIDRIHEADKLISTPREPPKEINGKCKLVHDKILSLKTDQEEDLVLSSLLTEWTEILQPNRIDWLTLLDNIKQRNLGLYFKMAEHVLDEDSFKANSRDYLKLVRAHTKDNRLDDAERILRKMTDKGGIQPDILTSTILVQMYSKTNNVERAKAAFDIMSRGFPPDIRTNKPTIMTVLTATQRIDTEMQFFARMQADLESGTLLVKANGQAGDPEQARRNIYNTIRLCYRRLVRDPEQARRTIDIMIRLGYRPDDRCTSNMLAAYENKNRLDRALNLSLEDEKCFGVVTGGLVYSDRIDWYRALELLVDEEELLRKVIEKGDIL